MLLSSRPSKDVFFCPEESNFYSYCLEALVLTSCNPYETILEFGAGDGSPIIKALLNQDFSGQVHGYELNPVACEVAKAKIKRAELNEQYIIHNVSFFEALKPKANYLVSNPPYLPAVDNKIYQPLLHGGLDGITVTQKLLSLNYPNVLVMASSYCNPEGLVNYAKSKGYYVANFIVSPLQFGEYSSEPKVLERIAELRKSKQAFYSPSLYLLAGVLFAKQKKFSVDVSSELLRVLMAL